ncbi:uncharacterized protein [Dendrobates tinctorius]|uniref:uncharacterized protein n=1 Tax=Dendrobates tinctorius TaxID=92724 RepID=UPI003CC98360
MGLQWAELRLCAADYKSGELWNIDACCELPGETLQPQNMDAPILLVIIQVLVTRLSANQPEDVVFADPGNLVNFTCVSSIIQGPRLITWYHRREQDAWTAVNNKSQKTASRSQENITHLVIDNVTSQDSGRYYCTGFNGKVQVFNKGITLITEDITNSSGSIHLLTPLHSTTQHFPVQLACVVHAVSPNVYTIWNISGEQMKGRMISWKKDNVTWITLNLFSLSENMWKNGEKVICEVWFSAAPITVHWKIPQRDKVSSIWLITVISVMCGLVLVSVIFSYYIFKHLETRQRRRRYNKSYESSELESDGIAYTELKIHSKTQR